MTKPRERISLNYVNSKPKVRDGQTDERKTDQMALLTDRRTGLIAVSPKPKVHDRRICNWSNCFHWNTRIRNRQTDEGKNDKISPKPRIRHNHRAPRVKCHSNGELSSAEPERQTVTNSLLPHPWSGSLTLEDAHWQLLLIPTLISRWRLSKYWLNWYLC